MIAERQHAPLRNVQSEQTGSSVQYASDTNSSLTWLRLGRFYAASALAAGDPGWGWRGRWNIYATAALFGLAWATLVEHAALAAGSWSYREGMPMVPWLRAGLWPLLQMTLLPPLTFWIARWWAGRNATKGNI